MLAQIGSLVDPVTAVARVVEESPGLSFAAVAAQLTGKTERRRAAIAEAIRAGVVQEGVTYHPTRGGAMRTGRGLFPAGRPVQAIGPPLTPAELEGSRSNAGVSQSLLAHRLGVSRALVIHWEQGRQPIPQGRAEEIRFVLADPSWLAEARQDRRLTRATDDELAQRVVAVVESTPGLPGSAVTEQLSGAAQRRWGALRRAELAGLVHRRLIVAADASGGRRRRLGFFRGPGPSPLEIPEDWLPMVMAAVTAEPMLTRTELRARIGYSPTILRAIDLAVDRGEIHETPRRLSSGRTVAGFSLGPSPTPATPPTGLEIRERRARAGATKTEMARRIGVGTGTFRRWEDGRGDVPLYLAATVEDALREAETAERPDPVEDLVPAVVELVTAEPGATRLVIAKRLGRSRLVSAAVERALERERIHEEVTGRERTRRRLYPGAFGPDPKQVAAELLELRRRSGWSQAKLAARLRLTTSMISYWETGQSPPSHHHLERAHVVLEEAVRALRQEVIDAIAAEPGISRDALLRGRSHGPGLGRGEAVKELLDELLAAGEIHEASALVENAVGVTRSGVGFFPGPPPPVERTKLAGDELAHLRRTVGLTRRALAIHVGVSKTQISYWEKGLQAIPPVRAEQLRQVLENVEPAPPIEDPRYTSDAELMADVLDVVRATPGISAREATQRVRGDIRRRWAAIRRLEDAGLIEARPVTFIDAGDRERRRAGLYIVS